MPIQWVMKMFIVTHLMLYRTFIWEIYVSKWSYKCIDSNEDVRSMNTRAATRSAMHLQCHHMLVTLGYFCLLGSSGRNARRTLDFIQFNREAERHWCAKKAEGKFPGSLLNTMAIRECACQQGVIFGWKFQDRVIPFASLFRDRVILFVGSYLNPCFFFPLL